MYMAAGCEGFANWDTGLVRKETQILDCHRVSCCSPSDIQDPRKEMTRRKDTGRRACNSPED